MKWRRIAMILSVVIAGGIAFGAGYAIGAMDTAKFLISRTLDFLAYKGFPLDISKVELIEYYFKLKGGI